MNYNKLYKPSNIIYFYWWKFTLGIFNRLFSSGKYERAFAWRRLTTRADRFTTPDWGEH